MQDKHLQSRFGYRCLKYHPLISSFVWVTFFLLAQTKSDVQLSFFGMPKFAHPFTVWWNCLDFNFSFLHASIQIFWWLKLIFYQQQQAESSPNAHQQANPEYEVIELSENMANAPVQQIKMKANEVYQFVGQY